MYANEYRAGLGGAFTMLAMIDGLRRTLKRYGYWMATGQGEEWMQVANSGRF